MWLLNLLACSSVTMYLSQSRSHLSVSVRPADHCFCCSVVQVCIVRFFNLDDFLSVFAFAFEYLEPAVIVYLCIAVHLQSVSFRNRSIYFIKPSDCYPVFIHRFTLSVASHCLLSTRCCSELTSSLYFRPE